MARRSPRRILAWVAGGLAALAALGALALLVVYPRVGAWQLERKVLARLEARTGCALDVATIEVGHGHAELRGVTVRCGDVDLPPLATIARVAVAFDFWPSLLGRVSPGAASVAGVRLTPHRAADGRHNLAALVARLAADDGDHGSPGGGALRRYRPATLEIRDVTVAATDDRRALDGAVASLEVDWTRGDATRPDQAAVRLAGLSVAGRDGGWAAALESLAGAWEAGVEGSLVAGELALDTSLGPRARIATVTVTDPAAGPPQVRLAGGEAALWRGMALTGIAGTVSPADAGRFAIALDGGYGHVAGTLWRATGWLEPRARTASVDLDADRFTLDRLAPLLRQSPVVAYEQATVERADLHVQVAPGVVELSGHFGLRDLTLAHPMLADRPVPALAIEATLPSLRLDLDARTATVAADAPATLAARGLPLEVSGTLALPGGRRPDGARRGEPALQLRLVVPRRRCQEVLEALPPEVVPYMQGFELAGWFDADVRVAIDWADLEATQLGGHVGIFGCRAVEAPDEIERLVEPFEHFVEAEQDQWLSFIVGPDNPEFVPLADVSPHLLNSLMTTEDSGFYKHRGFIVREFRSALIKNLEAGYFKYGASSITMQLVKNVLLYREKTAARKFQELFLTWYVETLLDKDRLFEIYVNVIEYGPALYGIGPAAMHYFGKHPRDLNPVEAAFFSSILPNPKERYEQFCRNDLRRATEGKIERILALMQKRERLTEDEHRQAAATPLTFVALDAETAEECLQRRKRALERARPTNPLKRTGRPPVSRPRPAPAQAESVGPA